jgi:class 3 adenylate cyclase/tetratricopeptide (TPR) repeat protein
MSICPSCGTGIGDTDRFCPQCGAPQARPCPSCGTENPPANRFCPSCGTALTEASAAAAAGSERRLVTVLFADLVGFTSLSEHRDPEEVRELLSSYFDRCRTLIERYGGTVEKFIGDAVMAVWGTPVAREDDAERAVRAGLALTQSVGELSDELRVRVGILTGSAAVDLRAESEGMVLGDTVNTASRLQSIAPPGSVLVDDVTRRASEGAIVYEDAGVHEVKGREQPVHAWAALRVVAGAGGARRSAGVEAPLVGRDHELQTIIEAGERSANEGCAKLVTIVGDAGSGKSRLLWEYFKYIDGIQEARWWHQGRCLSYGEGVGYWALAEMVRARAGITEEEPSGTAREKLHALVEEHVPDERERRLVEPRLAHLLRLEDRPEADRADLFSGWRLFFERLADSNPVILAFEDLQWADSGLLDFIDYLLEWSADAPIFVSTFGRPELLEKRPNWEPLALRPLDDDAIRAILEALVPGLPPHLITEIAVRAEGIPLYAVETIRMLQDRGLLVQEGPRYTVAGNITDLEVPETLHALVASRLDGLSAGERSLLQDASVLGQSFTAAAAAALTGRPEGEVTGLLDGLVAKQVLSRDDDPRSPERGQYVFLQGLLRTVAYGTLSRRARKARHIEAARYLERTWPGEAADIAEVLASHYLDAIAADPEADDVASLRAEARERLAAAGRAAASLALGPEAQRYLEQAAELTEDALERAELIEQAGRALLQSGDTDMAERTLRTATELYEGAGVTGGTAAVRLAALLRYQGGAVAEARRLLDAVIASEPNPVVRAEALAELAALLTFEGDLAEAGPRFDEALTILELEQAWMPLATALVSRSVYLLFLQRLEEGTGVLSQALTLAEERDLTAVALRARGNLAQVSILSNRFAEALAQIDQALELARERGDRHWERQLMGQLPVILYMLGRWDDAARAGATLMTGGGLDLDTVGTAAFLAPIASARGDTETLERCRAVASGRRDTTDIQQRVAALSTLSRVALESAAYDDAIRLAREALGSEFFGQESMFEAYSIAVEAAVTLEDETAIVALEQFVAELPPARAVPLLRAGRARLLAELAHRRGDAEEAARCEEEAIAILRAIDVRPHLANALVAHGRRRQDGDALNEGRAILEQLGAVRWLERIESRREVAA